MDMYTYKDLSGYAWSAEVMKALNMSNNAHNYWTSIRTIELGTYTFLNISDLKARYDTKLLENITDMKGLYPRAHIVRLLSLSETYFNVMEYKYRRYNAKYPFEFVRIYNKTFLKLPDKLEEALKNNKTVTIYNGIGYENYEYTFCHNGILYGVY